MHLKKPGPVYGAEPGRDLFVHKPFDPVSTGSCIPGGCVQFKDLFRTERLNGLDQADIKGFSIGILLDLLRPVLPL